MAPQTDAFIKAHPEAKRDGRHHPGDPGVTRTARQEAGSSASPSRRCCALVDAVAALLLAADLLVVCGIGVSRYVLDAPLEWADDVARGLMVALSFFGAAGALARSENVGVAFFVERLPPRLAGLARCRWRRLVVLVTAAAVAVECAATGRFTDGPDDRLRPAAGSDVLSDGRGRAFHGGVRAVPRSARHAAADVALAVVVAGG